MGDIYGNGKRVERALNLLEEYDLSESNRCYLTDFVQHRMAQNISDKRIYADLKNFRSLSEVIDFDLKNASKADLIRLVSKINHNDVPDREWKAETRKDKKKSIRNFYNSIDRSEISNFISLKIKASERNMVDPNELPSKKEVAEFRNAMCNERDKAFVACLWESGARIGEFLDLKWSDFKEFEDHWTVKLQGKTGPRRILLKECVPNLENWRKKQQPDRKGGDIWTSMQSENRLSYGGARGVFQRASKRIEASHRVNFHAFRKSRATYLSETLNIFQLMQFFGWSQMETAEKYVRLAEKDMKKAVLRDSRQSDLEEHQVHRQKIRVMAN